MTRIIAGKFGGRRLATPQGADTRPTADRVREAMFSGLDATHALYGRRFLDLYAGSGAVGLEAASRGAAHVLLVESDPRAARVIRENIAALGAASVATVAAQRVATVLAAGPPRSIEARDAAVADRGAGRAGETSGPAGTTTLPGTSVAMSSASDAGNAYDLVFADPPYTADEAEITAMLAALVDRGWVGPGALIVVERSKRSPEPTWVRSVTGERSRRYGEAMLWYGRRS